MVDKALETQAVSQREVIVRDTIRMVASEAVKDCKTSLDSQPTHAHAVFQNPEVLEPELRTFVGKPPLENPSVRELFQKQNPQVPNLMGPK